MVPAMALARLSARAFRVAVTPSSRTLRAELLRLCARIGYSPPAIL
ncbi:capsid protein [Mesorhizobium sp. NZP2077]|nr:capsid protein [Mesorhizobium sp. NZP2077]